MVETDIILSDEQQEFVDTAKQGKNILVDACIGSGKTTAIQKLCSALPESYNILYLTYNKLLKLDAKSKIKNKNAFVTNYHGFAYHYLLKISSSVGISELIQSFNDKKPELEKYDTLIIDEYQDIELEHAEMLEYIKSTNPKMQIIAVGDIDQKIYDKTTLDVIGFIDKFLGNYKKLQFTKCFRLPPDFAGMLGRVWNKQINGVNRNCIVEQMNPDEIVDFLSGQETGDILCLGARNGVLSYTLNRLESDYPNKFNKKTVYASIRDNDGEAVKPKKTSAIFTTFDSCKGMERKICVVFDFTESYWAQRMSKPLQSYEILRNIFCVAASRGKDRIIFANVGENMLSEKTLSESTETNFNLGNVNISDMFDFKYQEDIEKCYSALEIEKLDYNDNSEINIKNSDELIDLSPCIGIYQEAEFFENYNINKDIELRKYLAKDKKIYDNILKEKSVEKKILFLVSEETKQKRYITQVNTPFVSDSSRKKLIDRLSGIFSRDETVQVHGEIAFCDEDGNPIFMALGIADVVKEDTVYELKFVSELRHTHFLQCACYMIALNLPVGILINTRNNTAYRITIPNRNIFLDSVVNAVTKGRIKKYISKRSDMNKFAVIDTETNFDNEVMSIGVVIADKENFLPVETKYCILYPEYKRRGMYSYALKMHDKEPDIVDGRQKIIQDINYLLQKHGVNSIFAYNAKFDYKILPELSRYNWYDIMKVAAYKQHNSKITDDMECCSTGRLKRDYGVEGVMRLLTGNRSYYETHNALCDAIDELNIIKLIGIKYEKYSSAIYKTGVPSDESYIQSDMCVANSKAPIKTSEATVKDDPSVIGNRNDKGDDTECQEKSAVETETNKELGINQDSEKQTKNKTNFFKKILEWLKK